MATDREYISSISGLISRDATSPTTLPSAEAAAPTEMFNRVCFPPLDLPVSGAPGGQTIWDLSRPQRVSSWRLWFRLYTHALLLESSIFPNVELYDISPDFTPFGFTGIWKGNHHGEPVCIKAIRATNLTRLGGVKRICDHFICRGHTERASDTTSRREHKSISHPNLLPIIDVSDALFPFCIMSPWVPDGNIVQYIQMNPDANRLTLVRAYQLEAR